MVTPAAPRSRITSAALIRIFVRLFPRLLRAGVGRVVSDMVVLPFTVRPSRSVRVAEMRNSPVHGTSIEPYGPQRLAAKVGNLPGELVAGEIELNDQHDLLLGYRVPRAPDQPTHDYAMKHIRQK